MTISVLWEKVHSSLSETIQMMIDVVRVMSLRLDHQMQNDLYPWLPHRYWVDDTTLDEV
jgi:hypothetical protein